MGQSIGIVHVWAEWHRVHAVISFVEHLHVFTTVIRNRKGPSVFLNLLI